MKPRKHQIEFEEIISGIISGSPVRNIIVRVTPGGGKSVLPIIAGRLISANLADAICWVVPRKTLQHQGESGFIDPVFRKMFGHRRSIRSSTNEDNPCRGLSGFVTTYQAIGLDEGKTVMFEMIGKRYILFLDEFHHAELDGTWHEALTPLVERAEFIVLMTGTVERGDKNKIAFLPYRASSLSPDLETPCLEPTEKTAIIEYGRREALEDRAIIPLKFFLSDGFAQWINIDGTPGRSEISTPIKKDATRAVFTALSTDFADDLLNRALVHWQETREYNPGAKLLVITANYDLAKRTAKKLKARGFNSAIATSHESDRAQLAIKRYKLGEIDVLVTIAMAYEGLDVPEITHEACLTNIRSTPWIEQMVGRAVRIDRAAGPYESQMGYVFAPDDIHFREIMTQIEQEQRPILKTGAAQLGLFEEEEGGGGFGRPTIQPVGSKLNGSREVSWGTVDPTWVPVPKTPSEIESDLRERIEGYVRSHAIESGRKNWVVNGLIKAHFGKSRKNMTIPELETALEYVRKRWPKDKIRPRVPRYVRKV